MSSSNVFFYGDKLRDARRKKGLTQEVFADDVGATQSEISKYEHEVCGCYIGRAKKIIEQLDETYENLIKGSITEAIEKKRLIKTEEPQEKINRVYEKYFDSILKNRQKDLVNLNIGIDTHVIENRFKSLQDYGSGRTLTASEIVDDSIKSRANILVFGDSGLGKTFTCYNLFEYIREQYYHQRDANNRVIPLFIKLSKIRRKNLTTLIRENIDQNIFEKDKKKYIIFLDGLNEVGNFEEQEQTFDKINEFSYENPHTILFVTAQTLDTSFMSLDEFEVYEIRKLIDIEVISYLSKLNNIFKTKNEAETFHDSLSLIVQDLISVPIFLQMLVATYRIDRSITIGSNRDLIKKYVDFLCGSRSLSRLSMNRIYKERVIPFIAFNMCNEQKFEITWIRFNEYIEKFQSNFTQSINNNDFEDAVTNRFNIMRKDEDGDLKFIHQTLRDYFAVIHMIKANFSANKIIKIVYTKSNVNSHLIFSVRLLVGIVKPEISKKIIKKFIEKNLCWGCNLYKWSSIDTFDKEFVDFIDRKIDYSKNYISNIEMIIEFYTKTLDLLEKSEKLNEPIYASYLNSLGFAYSRHSEHEKAKECYKKAISIFKKNKLQKDKEFALLLSRLGDVYTKEFNFNKAIRLYKDAISIYKKNKIHKHLDYAYCLLKVGIADILLGKNDIAVQNFELAISILEQYSDKIINSVCQICRKRLREIKVPYQPRGYDTKSLIIFRDISTRFAFESIFLTAIPRKSGELKNL